MTDIASLVSQHSTAVMIGVGAGVVAAKVLHLIARVKRFVLPAIVLAAAGGTGAGAGSHVLNTLTTMR